MGLFHQLFQIGVGAKGGVHPGIIPGVVPVYRVCRKDRVEIQPADAQGGQIVQLFADAGQVAPKTFPVGHRAFPPGGLVGTAFAAAEPVRENLIPDGVPHPGRGRRDIGRVHPGLVKARRVGSVLPVRGTEAVLAVQPDLPAAVQFKMVAAPLVGRADHRSPPQGMGQGLGVGQFPALAVPALGPAQNARLKGVAPVQKDPFHLGAGLQAQHQLVGVQGIAPGCLGPVKNRGKIHTNFLRCRISGR